MPTPILSHPVHHWFASSRPNPIHTYRDILNDTHPQHPNSGQASLNWTSWCVSWCSGVRGFTVGWFGGISWSEWIDAWCTTRMQHYQTNAQNIHVRIFIDGWVIMYWLNTFDEYWHWVNIVRWMNVANGVNVVLLYIRVTRRCIANRACHDVRSNSKASARQYRFMTSRWADTGLRPKHDAAMSRRTTRIMSSPCHTAP